MRVELIQQIIDTAIQNGYIDLDLKNINVYQDITMNDAADFYGIYLCKSDYEDDYYYNFIDIITSQEFIDAFTKYLYMDGDSVRVKIDGEWNYIRDRLIENQAHAIYHGTLEKLYDDLLNNYNKQGEQETKY